MRHRTFGRIGWSVSEIGYGAWQIGGNMWGTVEEERAEAALEAALEAGIDFFDTALAYGMGRSERLVGRVLRRSGARERVRVATKVPPRNGQWPARAEAPLREVFPAAWIRECAERSLDNLDIGAIDLLQLHVWTDSWADDAEWYEALAALREEGSIRALGVSVNDHDPASALRVTRSGRIDSLQVIYNVFDQSPARELFPAAREMDVGVIVRVPLDEGSLAGRLTTETRFPPQDMRSRYFAPERLPEVVRRVEALRPVLETDGQSMAEGALRFCLSDPAVSTVIVGSADPAHVRRNAAVSEQGPLPAATVEALRGHAWPRNFYPA
ncbi:MAG TPA: aldo/keto reductase [Longimicrobiales bacterium]|nr:aldo/keto reductase [Longimicrobiales bacterium]